MPTPKERLKIAAEILEGVALGDAFGEHYSYYAYDVRNRVANGLEGTWRYTDDTIMSLGVFECLAKLGQIEQDVLAWIFGSRFQQETERGYGKMARKILRAIANGENWEEHSKNAFNGGSMGNGAAMRVAPLAAWFHDDLNKLSNQARLSAQVTHWHHEAQVGAVAIAIATAEAFNTRALSVTEARTEISNSFREYMEESEVRETTLRALEMHDCSHLEAAKELGAGQLILSQDTVPYSIWCALQHLDDFEEAMLCSVEPNGDCDTVAAINAGIVTARIGKSGLPTFWLKHREPIIYQAI